MNYHKAIDMDTIRSWVKADRGIITEVAKELKIAQGSVSKNVLGYNKTTNARVIEKILEKIVERQGRMIALMTRIKVNNEILSELHGTG